MAKQQPEAIRPIEGEGLFCFDFDQTLVKGHFHNELTNQKLAQVVLKGKPGIIVEEVPLEGSNPLYDKNKVVAAANNLLDQDATGFKNRDGTRETFKALIKQGHKIAITSFSLYPDAVTTAVGTLDLTVAERQNVVVITGFPVGKMKEAGKQQHIQAAKDRFQIQDISKVMLVDDSVDNINVAVNAGIQVIQVDKNEKTAPYLSGVCYAGGVAVPEPVMVQFQRAKAADYIPFDIPEIPETAKNQEEEVFSAPPSAEAMPVNQGQPEAPAVADEAELFEAPPSLEQLQDSRGQNAPEPKPAASEVAAPAIQERQVKKEPEKDAIEVAKQSITEVVKNEEIRKEIGKKNAKELDKQAEGFKKADTPDKSMKVANDLSDWSKEKEKQTKKPVFARLGEVISAVGAVIKAVLTNRNVKESVDHLKEAMKVLAGGKNAEKTKSVGKGSNKKLVDEVVNKSKDREPLKRPSSYAEKVRQDRANAKQEGARRR